MTIGERIKHYRLQNQMTQEKLAVELNISFQAVSKWERNESLPDITLIARLAEILNVTCDALLTENSCFTESEIDAVICEASALYIGVHESYSQRIDLLEKALEKYPHSIRLMLELADSYSKGSAYPEYKEKNYLQKTVDIEEYVAAHTTDPVQKYQTTTMLCYMYRALEKYDRIRELAETNMTMVIVTHEMEFAHDVSDRIIFMADGLIEADGAPDDVLCGNNEKLRAFLGNLSE